MLSSLENDNLNIEEACVPAEVLCVQYTGENTAHKDEEILSFFSEFSNLGEVKILANHSVDDFREKCHQARIGK